MESKMRNKKNKEVLSQFLSGDKDSFCILQLESSEKTADERFMNLDWLQRKGWKPDVSHYNAVYSGYFPTGTDLENLYYQFNVRKPKDFTGHSLSVSDIVALKVSDVISCYYVDSIGFKKLEDFRISKIVEEEG